MQFLYLSLSQTTSWPNHLFSICTHNHHTQGRSLPYHQLNPKVQQNTITSHLYHRRSQSKICTFLKLVPPLQNFQHSNEVLWPESGWQQVSLTDLITSTSVKKVYYKATLCVHPDKVQQKGASLQQKYIAEKVFDLLKEAWNKFNSEEMR